MELQDTVFPVLETERIQGYHIFIFCHFVMTPYHVHAMTLLFFLYLYHPTGQLNNYDKDETLWT